MGSLVLVRSVTRKRAAPSKVPLDIPVFPQLPDLRPLRWEINQKPIQSVGHSTAITPCWTVLLPAILRAYSAPDPVESEGLS
jgi:hypothetical protein